MNERLMMQGKLAELESRVNYLKTKIKGSSQLLRENCCLSLKDSYDQLDDQIIKVFASELVQDIRSLRDINDKIKLIQLDLGEG